MPDLCRSVWNWRKNTGRSCVMPDFLPEEAYHEAFLTESGRETLVQQSETYVRNRVESEGRLLTMQRLTEGKQEIGILAWETELEAQKQRQQELHEEILAMHTAYEMECEVVECGAGNISPRTSGSMRKIRC